MLTKDEILKAARLMNQVGELRPGFLNDGAANIGGPDASHNSNSALRQSRATNRSRIRSTGKRVKVCLAFQEDPETGEIRIVQKRLSNRRS